MRVATAAPDGLHTHEDAEVLIDFGDAGVLSGRRDSPQSRPPSEAAPSRSQCGPTFGTFVSSISSRRYHFNSRRSLKETGKASGNTCLRQAGGPRLGATVAPEHCGSHARTVVLCAHSGGVGQGTRPLVRSQRTVI